MWLFCLLDPFIPTQIKFLATPLEINIPYHHFWKKNPMTSVVQTKRQKCGPISTSGQMRCGLLVTLIFCVMPPPPRHGVSRDICVVCRYAVSASSCRDASLGWAWSIRLVRNPSQALHYSPTMYIAYDTIWELCNMPLYDEVNSIMQSTSGSAVAEKNRELLRIIWE